VDVSASDQLGNAARQLEEAERQAREAERVRRDAQREWEGGRLPLGLILLAIGSIFTAERLGYLEIDQVWRFWPLFFVVMAVKSLVRWNEDSIRGAFAMLFMAAIFFMHNFQVVSLQYSWPLFIVLAGIMIVWGALAGSACQGSRS
jgi:hypothetical protein